MNRFIMKPGMKARIAALFFPAGTAVFPQAKLPRLAVAAFSVNDRDNSKLLRDTAGIRNQVQSNIVASGRSEVIMRDEIDALITNRQIQISSISSRENITKLQLLNIAYIITGTVDAFDSDYNVTLSILDVGNGRFTHSTDHFMGSASRDMVHGTKERVAAFLREITADQGRVVQTRPELPAPTVPAPVNFVYVESGTFSMGSNNENNDEKPVHTVTVKSFYMGKYEVTQKEWREIMGNNPSRFKGDNLPVEMVSREEAVEYCNRRRAKEGLTPAYTGARTGIGCRRRRNGSMRRKGGRTI
jgi:hypothetical protein